MACRKHTWKRLFTRPDDSDTDRRLSYVLAGYERLFVCTSCSVVAKKAHQTGRMAVLLFQEHFQERAATWNADLKQLKEKSK